MEWSSLIYQFAVGGVIFAVGLLVPLRAGDYSLRRRSDRRTILFMLAGVLFYLAGQTLWHLAAIG